ncbi:APC family permease [Leucobacter sp. CSA2]|uniref:APC family permease n=1 Tax=Leucobacter edaphi TaxID=2796472 RepID=A0A934QEZ8_9MICO|nr:APC family permease [Leucobacter edaphi]MBK0422032.1 APC family permease [Leucobacter edaphi]
MSTTQQSRPVDAGLRRGVMGGAELGAQAIANIAPSAVLAFTAAAIFVSAGNGTLLSLLFATIVILSVGWCVAVFARKNASAGSIYTYVAKSLGPTAAYVAGLALIIGCWGVTAGSLGGGVSYAADLLQAFGVPAAGLVGFCILTLVLGAITTFFTIQGIQISARVSFVLEIASVLIILTLFVTSLIVLGPDAWDPQQFSLEGAPPQGIAAGMVLGVLGFAGFSSADALGREAKHPYRTIPRVIMWSVVGIGLIYLFGAYTQIAVLGDELAGSANPLQDIADKIGMPGWFTMFLLFGVAASFSAVCIAALNVLGRIVYVMGKEGVVHESLGRTHRKHLTPHRVLLIGGVLSVAVNIALLLAGVHPMDIVVWLDTYGVYGYMVAYALVAFACAVYVRKMGMPRKLVTVCAVIAVLAMAYIFFANVWPVPAFPLNLLPYLFVATMAVGIAWFIRVKKVRPEVLSRIGNTETDALEGIG